MCGIAGIVAFDGRQVSTSLLKSMTDCMVQRGPDDDGFFAHGSSGIGMRRLSIIDVAGGHQPLINETGDIHLVLNGEIYNHVELRQQLVARGHVFRTASDAEVVLHLYEDQGVRAVEALNGMFGFALYDSRKQAMWVVRDRVGIKPIFYATSPESLAFASDIQALRAAHPTTIDPRQALKYFALGYVPADESMWRGVLKLPPAHYLWVENGRVSTHRYWSLPNVGMWRGSVAEAEEQLEALLVDAVRLELRSDVPLGVYLSGGLDSSTIVALASKQLSEPLRTFTIEFVGKKSADEHFARVVAEQYGTAHTEIPMGPGDASSALAELLPMMDEPIADSAFIPAYWLAKAARERGIKVLLNGAGGDEVFGGYSRHSRPRFGSPTWVAEALPRPLRRIVADSWSWFQPHRGVRANDPLVAWAATVSGVNLHDAGKLLRDPADVDTMLEAIRVEYRPLAATNGTKAGGLGYTHTRMALDLRTYLPGDVLALMDKATMATSVEGRVPLLDHRLVEFAFSLPLETNLLGGQPKGLLKRAMSKHLPAALMNRRKEGFNAPDDVWLRADGEIDLREELIDRPSPVLDELIEPKALERLLGNGTQRSRSASLLFAMFLFNRWQSAHSASTSV